MDPDCVFCSIVAGDAPVSLVHRTETVIAFMDINPVTPGHLLVVPRQHNADLTDIEPTIAGEMMMVAQRLGAALRRTGLRVEGINLFYADGVAAGQEVFHGHLHVIPRFAGDGFRVEPQRSDPPTRAELDRIAAGIR